MARMVMWVAALLLGGLAPWAEIRADAPACEPGEVEVQRWQGSVGPALLLVEASDTRAFELAAGCEYGDLTVTISWASQLQDLDLEVTGPGDRGGTSASFQFTGPGEAVTLANAVAGAYTARVTGFISSGTSYTGVATVQVLGPAAAVEEPGPGNDPPPPPPPGPVADEARVVVAVVDSAINPYHEFFYQQPVRVTEDLLQAFGVGPQHRVRLTRSGSYAQNVEADKAFWDSVVRGQTYYFEGTNILARSHAGAGLAPLIPSANKSPHGVGVSASVINANPEAIILFVETEGALGNDDAQQYAFTHPAVDMVNTSYGFQVPFVGVPLPLPLTYSFSFEGVVNLGKLHFSAAGNGVGVTALDPGAGTWWGIGVSGFEEGSSNGDTSLFSSNVADFVADFTQTLPYCMACMSGVNDFVSGTSFSSPQAAGVASRVLLEARRMVGHGGGIVIEDGRPLMARGKGFEISNWFLRRALEQAARIPGPLEYDPIEAILDLGALPVNPIAPWLQVGWGDLSFDPAFGVVDAALSHLNLKPARFARSKDRGFCDFQTAVMEFRFRYWNEIDGLQVSENPVIACGDRAGLRASNDPGGRPQDRDNDGIVDALDPCPDDPENVCDGAAPMTVSLSATPTTGPASPEQPLVVTFTASATNPGFEAAPLRYTFHFGDGSEPVAGPAASVQHAYRFAGEHSAFVIVNDDNGRHAVSDTVLIRTTTSVVVDPPPVATQAVLAIAEQIVAEGGLPVTVRFDATQSRAGTGRQLVRHTLAFGDGQQVSREGAPGLFTHVYTTAGSFRALLTVEDDEGTQATAEATVQVTGREQALTAQLAVSPNRLIEGESATLDACASFPRNRITAYRFRPEGETGPVITRPVVEGDHEAVCRLVHVYARAGSFEPALTVLSGEGEPPASAQAKAQLQVLPRTTGSNPTPTPPGSSPPPFGPGIGGGGAAPVPGGGGGDADTPRAPARGSGALGALTLLPLVWALRRRRLATA